MAGALKQNPRFVPIPLGNEDMFPVEGADNKDADALRGQGLNEREHDSGRIERERAETAKAAPVAVCIHLIRYPVLRADDGKLVVGADYRRKAGTIGPGRDGGVAGEPGQTVDAWNDAQLY